MADLSRHHPGRALLESKNSPLAKAVQSLDVARLRELLDAGEDANSRIGVITALHDLCSTRYSVESWSEPPPISEDGLAALSAQPTAPRKRAAEGDAAADDEPAVGFKRAHLDAPAEHALAALRS